MKFTQPLSSLSLLELELRIPPAPLCTFSFFSGEVGEEKTDFTFDYRDGAVPVRNTTVSFYTER